MEDAEHKEHRTDTFAGSALGPADSSHMRRSTDIAMGAAFASARLARRGPTGLLTRPSAAPQRLRGFDASRTFGEFQRGVV